MQGTEFIMQQPITLRKATESSQSSGQIRFLENLKQFELLRYIVVASA